MAEISGFPFCERADPTDMAQEGPFRTSAGRGMTFCANLASCSQISSDRLSKQSLPRGYTIIASL